MKPHASIFFALGLIAAASGAGPAAAAEAEQENVAFTEHSGHFVSNKFEPEAKVSFVWLEDQKSFDSVFGTVMAGGLKATRLPSGVFEKRVVAAVIHRGAEVVNYTVESLKLDGKSLILRYSTKCQPHASATFACPLIVSLPKGGYAEIRFIENGKEVHRLKPGAAAAADWRIEAKEPGIVTASQENGRCVLTIKDAKGIGRATVEPKGESWPKDVVIRAHLRGLEQLVLTCDGEKVSASVASHGSQETRVHRWSDGKEGAALSKDSPFFAAIRLLDAAGKPAPGLPPEGGWFEISVPRSLLEKGGALQLEWIDFYR
jgi:hypothetical protein